MLSAGKPEEALPEPETALDLTHSAQEVWEAIDDLVELQAADPFLPGLAIALRRLRVWPAERDVARQVGPATAQPD